MSELRIPNNQEEFDAINVFELARFFQNDLERFTDMQEYDQYRLFALDEVGRRIRGDMADGIEYRVDSTIAILEDDENKPIAEMKDVRLFGAVAAVGMMFYQEYPHGMALKLDTVSMSFLDEPESISTLIQLVNTPIVSVVDAKPLHIG